MNKTFKIKSTFFLINAMVAVLFFAFGLLFKSYFLFAIPFIFLIIVASFYQKEFIFYLLIISIPFSFEYNFSNSLSTDVPDEFLMLLVSSVFYIYFFSRPISFIKVLVFHPLFILLCLLFAWALVATIFSTDKIVSIKYLLAKSWYFGAFIIAPFCLIFNDKKALSKMAIYLLSSMLIVTIIIFVKHFFNGFQFSTINNAVSPFFRNHVNYSALLACMLPITIAFKQFSQKKYQKYLLNFILFFILSALFFSYSRGAWLASIGGIVVFFLIKKNILFPTYILLSGIVIVAIIVLNTNENYLKFAPNFKQTIFHKNFNEHLIATYQLQDVSSAERYYRWVAAFRMIRQQPFIGTGPNTFYKNYKSFTLPIFKTWVSDNKEHSTVHNYFLLIAIEQGLPAVIFFIIFCFVFLFYAQRGFNSSIHKFDKIVYACIASIFFTLLVINFLSDMVEVDKTGSIFLLCTSIMIAMKIKKKV